MTKTTKNKGLRNPAVLAAASSPAGQQAIATAAETSGKAVNLAMNIVKVVLIAGVAYFIYTKVKGSFKKQGTNPNFDPANVSDGQAEAKANALYEAMAGPGANLDAVADQLAGLNYNGWVKVYNAFGHRKGVIPFSSNMTLTEWLHDQFDEEQLQQLRFVLPGVF